MGHSQQSLALHHLKSHKTKSTLYAIAPAPQHQPSKMSTDTLSSPTSLNSPPTSQPTSRRASRAKMSIDLSAIPPLQMPTPPSNTLLITNLQDIRELINTSAPIHSWAPLKSFRRIIVSFFDEASAIRIRQILDGEAIMGERVKVYFGQPTSIEVKDEHLNLPDAGKLFFISPPPSPPHGWEMKLEDAPNKLVHADDLAEALAKLHAKPRTDLPASPISDGEEGRVIRTRSGSSTTIYNPSEHGHSPNLPAISVEDLTGENEFSPIEQEKPILAHTSRPVELMEHK